MVAEYKELQLVQRRAPTIFYPLYIFAEGAATYFPAVFAAGLVLLVCEHVSVTMHARRLLREEAARLRQLNHLKN